jgi:hypothetical protein
MAYVQANLPAQCTSRGLTIPAEYHAGLPVVTMIQTYPACVVDVDSGSVGGAQATEIEHSVFVAVVDRDAELDVLNLRLMQYADAILATLDGKRFGTVIRCMARKHDSSNLFTTGDSRAVRMRWVELSVRTVN